MAENLILKQIENLVEEVTEIRDLAVFQNRDLTVREADRMESILDQIDELEAEGNKITHPSVTCPRNAQYTKDGRLQEGEYDMLGAFHSFSDDKYLTRSKSDMKKSNGPFKSFGEQMAAVRYACTPGGTFDNRLGEFRSASGLSEGVGSEGNFLVQNDFSNMLFSGIFQDEIIGRCNKIELSGNSNSIKINAIDEAARTNGNRWGGIRVYHYDEATEATKSKPTFRQLEIKLYKMIGLCYSTDEILSDAGVLEKTLQQGFQEEMVFTLTDDIIRGTGAGMSLGLLNSGCLVSVAKEVGQAAASITLLNVLKMKARMLPRARKNAVWIIHADVEEQLYRLSLEIGTAGSTVPAYKDGMLLDIPVIVSEHANAIGSQGDIILAAFDYYLLATKGAMKAESSVHVRFIFDEMTYRFTWRVSGQPFYSQSITPYQGTNEISTFIVLDDRD